MFLNRSKQREQRNRKTALHATGVSLLPLLPPVKTSFARRARMAKQVYQEGRTRVLEQEQAEVAEESQNGAACNWRFSASSAASC